MIKTMTGWRCFMPIRALATAALLLSVCVPLIFPAPVQAAGLTLSPAEGIAGTEVMINMLSSYGSGEFSIHWGDSEQILEQGNEENQADAMFTVPTDTRGKHSVSLKIGGHTYKADFTILPSLSLSETGGGAYSDLTVSGSGFNANETNIELFFDDTTLTSGIGADEKGSWQATVQVPVGPSGVHNISAGGTTPVEEVAAVPFEIKADIAITPSSGSVGTMVEINGAGFASSETGITVAYDGLAVKTAIAANSTGSWQSSFFVPASTKGRHDITAFGELTLQGDVDGVTFTVAPILKLEMASGNLGDAIHAGNELWISGIGFEENEGGIQVTFDGTMIASNITADAKGSWAIRIQVPASIRGNHSIDASGRTTLAETVTDTTLVVSPQISLSATTGAIDELITIDGTGFGSSQEITISIDGNKVDTNATSDAKGNFAANFTVPAIGAGEHTITVSDATAAVASVQFELESVPPPLPALLSPEAGKRVGVIGSAVVTFEWEEVEDPSGVIYMLEVGQSSDFSGSMLRKENLTQTHYSLTEEEALKKGTYYWRVKAIDGAGNESDWAVEHLFKVGLMEWWAIPLIILAFIVVILIAWRVIVLSRRGEWK